VIYVRCPAGMAKVQRHAANLSISCKVKIVDHHSSFCIFSLHLSVCSSVCLVFLFVCLLLVSETVCLHSSLWCLDLRLSITFQDFSFHHFLPQQPALSVCVVMYNARAVILFALAALIIPVTHLLTTY